MPTSHVGLGSFGVTTVVKKAKRRLFRYRLFIVYLFIIVMCNFNKSFKDTLERLEKVESKLDTSELLSEAVSAGAASISKNMPELPSVSMPNMPDFPDFDFDLPEIQLPELPSVGISIKDVQEAKSTFFAKIKNFFQNLIHPPKYELELIEDFDGDDSSSSTGASGARAFKDTFLSNNENKKNLLDILEEENNKDSWNNHQYTGEFVPIDEDFLINYIKTRKGLKSYHATEKPPNLKMYFHNRMPKCGSSSLKYLLKELSKRNNFDFLLKDGFLEYAIRHDASHESLVM